MSQRIVAVQTPSRSYDVIVGVDLLAQAGPRIKDACAPDAAIVVSDEHVAPLYLDIVRDSLNSAGVRTSTVIVPAGEQHKGLESYAKILEAMAADELTRDSVVVALGGGVVGDMAGFAAATYMRGIQAVQVPTTLLAMVDSSVGGKTAVDLSCGKNLVGAFLQPSLVIADVSTLKTLDDEVFVDGIGEIVKHAVLADANLFDDLLKHPLTRATAPERLVEIVARNVEIKRDVVAADETEQGVRQTLNLGHTIGHGIEAASGYTLGHGHCVAIGLCYIARAAVVRKWASEWTGDAVQSCVAAQGLPTATDIDPTAIYEQATHDKKRHGTRLNMVIPKRVGLTEICSVTLEDLRELIDFGAQKH